MMSSSHHVKKKSEIPTVESMETNTTEPKKKIPTVESMETNTTEPKENKLTGFLKWLTIVTCLGASQCGFNLWIVGDPSMLKENADMFHVVNETRLNPHENIHPILMIFAVASFLLGCLCGSILFGPMADKYGRKGTLLANDIFSMIASITLAISKYFVAYFIHAWALFLTGLCTGLFTCGVPMYLGEVSPSDLRGRLVCIHVMFVSIGMFISQTLSAPHILGNKTGFPILMSIPAIIAFFQFVLLLRFPESPPYLLIQKQDEEGARKALMKLRGQDDVEKEMEKLREEDVYEKREKKMMILKLMCFPTLRWQLFCAIILFATQQFSGVNVMYFYTDRIFLAMHVNKKNVKYLEALLTFLVLFSHGFSILKIDTWGRRRLLLGGLLTCMVSCVLLTMIIELQVIVPQLIYISSFIVVIFLFATAVGPSSIPYLITVELFLQSSRASAFAIVGFFRWFLLFLICSSFILTEKYIKSYSFIIWLPLCIAGFVYIVKFVPETKKKTILDVRKFLEPFLAERYLRAKMAAKKKKRGRN